MNSKRLNLALMLVLTLMNTSCLEIIEHYRFRADGSGTFSIELDLKEVKELMQEVKNDANMEYKAIKFEKEELRLGAVDGISNIVTTPNLELYNFQMSFDFTSIIALNNALNTLYESENLTYVMWKKNNFSIKHKLPSSFITAQRELSDSLSTSILAGVRYSLDLQFNQGIKKVSSEALIVQSEQTALIRTSLDSLAHQPDLLNTQIKLK